MTVVSVASFLQAASHPAHNVRRYTRSLFDRGGVIPCTATFTDLKVTQRGAGANMSVDVAEGSCLVTGTEATYQGLYHCDNQGTTNVTITAADATNARKDLIVARIKDTEYGVAVTDEFLLEAVAGTPSGTPADPTVPANCIVLARVAVAANATSITNANITDLRNNYAAVTGSAVIGNQQKAVATGGVVPCLSTARPTVGLYEGLTIYETDTKASYIYNGSAWIPAGGSTAAGRIHQTANVGISGDTLVTMGATDYLRGGMTTSSNGLVVPVAGLYHCTAHLGSVNGNANAALTGMLLASIQTTGGNVVARNAAYFSGWFGSLTVSIDVPLSANDYLRLYTQCSVACYYVDPTNGYTTPSSICAFLIGPT